MNALVKTALTLVSLATMGAVASLVYEALSCMGARQGLGRYFSLMGVDIDLGIIVIVVGLIPVLWLAGFIARTWSLK